MSWLFGSLGVKSGEQKAEGLVIGDWRLEIGELVNWLFGSLYFSLLKYQI
jgi:hypothetical protein